MTAGTREQYESRWKNYYEVLQVHPRAEHEVIAAAYRKLAFLYHPDRNPDPAATERLKSINEAYDVLSDASRRIRYDSFSAAYSFEAERPSCEYSAEAEPDIDGEEGWNGAYAEPDYEMPPDSGQQYAGPSHLYRVGMWSRTNEWFRAQPGEANLILPWLSRRAQLLLLLVSFLMGLASLAGGIAQAMDGTPQAAISYFVIVLILVASGLYAAIATNWLRQTQQAPFAARLAGGANITVGGVALAIAAVYAVVIVAMIVFAFTLTCAMARSALDKT